MIKILFFAGLREKLGIEKLQWPTVANIETLLNELKAQDALWQEALARSDLLCARNQELCGLNEPLNSGDEVAFFPPVTGG